MIYERVRQFLSEQIRGQAAQSTGRASLGSTIGRVRKENQDRSIVAEFVFPQQPERNRTAFVLCDGIGGMAGGALAAEMAAAAFVDGIFECLNLPISDAIQVAASRANQTVFQEHKGKGGSTLVAALFSDKDSPLAVSIGDSRVYAVDERKELLQLSHDDNLGAIARLGANLQVDPAQASHLTQYCGMGNGIEPNIIPIVIGYKRLLLTSDGVHGCSPEILKEYAVKIEEDLSLVQSLLTVSNHFGGKDNASIIAMHLPIGKITFGATKGMIVRLSSPYSTMEIWLPQIQETLQLTVDRQHELRVFEERPTKQKKSKSSTKRTRRQSRKPSLPVGELKLEFPGKDD